ncbi:flagellar hook-length control protein FliK [Anaeromicropila populeti]|uniref:S1 motif domain-containing protein n=1 Tax=Anaeromicropila populeti TaxID=37658 RepID=A0A1I6LIZ4_9FIRM|nr:flagellar hook-length control protein FliK [Anaeromicropila populeti]SFS03290.1 hypothetical protein SAMN05661086_03303 [Anaeromicropila populeti]
MDLSSKKINPSQTTINQRSAPKGTGQSVGRMSDYGARAPIRQLTEGQVIKGEVTDLRNNEVTVLLDDNTKVTGRLDHVSWLSIGDVAAFKVAQIMPGKISLQAIPFSTTLMESNTMFKALEEAGLPKNERNQEIVLSLIRNQMPINKQSILNILKQSYELKDIGVSSIVLMNKLNIPTTAENATQFENYRSSQHYLADNLQSLIREFPGMLKEILSMGEPEQIQSFAEKLLAIVDSSSDQSAQQNLVTAPYIFSSNDAKEDLLSILDTFGMSGEEREAIEQGTATLTDLQLSISKCYQNALFIDERNAQEALASIENADSLTTTEITNLLSEVPKTVEVFDQPEIQSINQLYQEYLKENQLVGGFFDVNQREDLISFFEKIPNSDALIKSIQSGQASLADVVSALKSAIPVSDSKELIQLLESPAFPLIMSESLRRNWFLSPKDLKKTGSIQGYYDKLFQKTQQLDLLLKTSSLTDEESGFAADIHSMKSNLQFMQLLNDVFPYMQLPLFSENGSAHADLYVYTKKKELQTDPSSLKVLLRLDKEHLGSLDIFLTLSGRKLESKYYVQDDFSRKLLKKNINLADAKLRELGYQVSSEFIKEDPQVDIVNDFIAQKESAASIKRYTFDIRA